MKRITQLLSLVLVLCLLVGSLPTPAIAAEVGSGACGENVTWVLTDDGTLTISGSGPMADYKLFQESPPWSGYTSRITNGVIEEGVTTVGEQAFDQCSELLNVSIPDTVTMISRYAFYSCSKLTGVSLPNSVTVISSGAFSGCTSLTSIVIPPNVEEIGASAFAYCSNLSEIRFKGDAPVIADDAFYIPNPITAYYPADNPTWTADVMQNYGGNIEWLPDTYAKAEMEWSLSSNGVLTISCEGSMGDFSNPEDRPWHDKISQIKSVVISEGVIDVGAYAFAEATNLTSVSLPDSLTTIGQDAFAMCSSLRTVEIPDAVTTIGFEAFAGCSNLGNFELPDGLTTLGMNAFAGCTSMTELNIPAATNAIAVPMAVQSSISRINVDPENTAFASLDGVLFNRDYTALGCYPGARTDTSYTVPNGVELIAYGAFATANTLRSVTLPATVQQIADLAFAQMGNLSSITFTGNAPTFGADVFSQDTLNAYYPRNNTTWTSSVRQQYGGKVTWTSSNVTPVQLAWSISSDGVLTISGQGAMDDYTNPEDRPWNSKISQIKSVVVSEGVTRIGMYAFTEAANLERVSLPDSLACIKNGAFFMCPSLHTIAIPAYVTQIMPDAFAGCSSLANIELPNTLKALGMNAFAGCTNMTELNIPATTVYIEVPVSMDSSISQINVDAANSTFASVDGVLFSKDLTMLGYYPGAKTATTYAVPDGVTGIAYCAFAGDFSLQSIEIPASVQEIADYAFTEMDSLSSITFAGDAPIFGVDVFAHDTVTVYYPADNATWTADVMQQYGGTVIWVAKTQDPNVVASGTCGENLTWVLSKDGTLTISGEGAMTDFESDAEPWKAYKDSITTVNIGHGVTSIGNYAFFGYTGVTAISIPTSITRIGEAAFGSLGVTGTLVLPEGVVTIGQGAFQGAHMTEIVLPSSVESIGLVAFINCPNLTFIRVDEDNVHYSNDSNGFLYNKDQTKLVQVYGLAEGSFDIPSTVTTIGEASIFFCRLTNVTIPASVTTIEQMAMASSGIQEVVFEGSAPIFGAEVFYGNTVTVYYPVDDPTWTADVMQQYGGTITWIAVSDYIANGTCGENLTWVLSEDGILTISGEGAMADFTSDTEPWGAHSGNITTVKIEHGVTSIGNWAFYGYSNVTEISIPNSVVQIGEAALAGLGEMDKLVIPEGVVTIGQGAFQGSYMKEVVIPASVESIGLAVFMNCPKLMFIRVDEDNPHYSNDSNGFLYNKGKTKLIAVYGLAAGSFTIPSTVTTIGEASMYFCPYLTNVTIPASVTTIEQMGLAVTGIKELIFEGNAPALGANALYGLTATVYYPTDDATWTADVMQQYDGEIIWTAYSRVYEVIEEGTQTEVTEGESLAVHIDAEYSEEVAEEVEVYVNGELVAKENYTVTQGSVIITFTPEYLATLEEGEYAVTVRIEDGLAQSTVTVPPAYVPGDINGDGNVNARDVTKLLQYLAEWDVEVVEAALDVNGNGKVNARDVTTLKQSIAGWDVEIN